MPFGAWEKLQLGWLDYDVVRAGRTETHKLRPGQAASGTHPNGMVVLLPNKNVPLELGAPCADCGSRYYYSDQGNDLDTTMTRTSRVVASSPPRSATTSRRTTTTPTSRPPSDGGDTWDERATSPARATRAPDGTGVSTNGQWVDLTATVPDGTNALRWRYVTDGGVALSGFQVDNITLDGTDIGDAETDAELGVRRVPHHDRHRGPVVPQRLHRGQPPVRRAGQAAQAHLQLRQPRRAARTGWTSCASSPVR